MVFITSFFLIPLLSRNQIFCTNIMALIKFGMMMTDARGKLGGQVFTKTRSGATVRTKVTPANPQTVAQQIARSVFGSVSASWRGLDESERLAWNAAVTDWSRTNIFGDSYLPSGKNLFVQVNSNLGNVDETLIDVPAPPEDLPPFIASGTIVDNSEATITPVYSSTIPGIGYHKVIEATRPFSAGRFNFSGAFAKITTWPSGTPPTDLQIYTDYVAKYGSPSIGQKIGFRFYYVNRSTGQKSTPSQSVSIVIG